MILYIHSKIGIKFSQYFLPQEVPKLIAIGYRNNFNYNRDVGTNETSTNYWMNGSNFAESVNYIYIMGLFQLQLNLCQL